MTTTYLLDDDGYVRDPGGAIVFHPDTFSNPGAVVAALNRAHDRGYRAAQRTIRTALGFHEWGGTVRVGQ